MASKTSDVSLFMDFEDKPGSFANLQFQDFPQGTFVNDAPPNEKTHNFSNFPESHADNDDDLSTAASTEGETGTSPSMWTFSYYQRFFDIDTADVKERLVWSAVPRPSQDFLSHIIKRKPDLYGPFWVCATLIFCTAIMGNISDYFQSAGEGSHWRYDFRKVSISATTIFSYATLLPLALWVFIWWRKKLGEQVELGFVDIVCLYGYSLTVYVPVSVLWTIPLAWLQWSLVLVAATLSGSVLLIALWKPLSSSKKSIAAILLVAILIAHLFLAAGLQLYFFRYSSDNRLQNNALNQLDPKVPEPVKPVDEGHPAASAKNPGDSPQKNDSKTKRDEDQALLLITSKLNLPVNKGDNNSIKPTK